MTSMQKELIVLSEQIASGQGDVLALNDQFLKIISESSHISECLQILGQSDMFLFVYCNNMVGLIRREELNIVSETRSEENVTLLGQNSESPKAKIFG